MFRERTNRSTTDSPIPPLTLTGAHTPALLKLTACFLVSVVISFVTVESWRVIRDYHQAFTKARDSATNLARATAQHAEDAIRQVDLMTDALRERVEGDGLENLDVPRIHALLTEQKKLMPQLHGLFIYGPNGDRIVTDNVPSPNGVNSSDRDYFIYHRTHADRRMRIGDVITSRSSEELIIPISRRLNKPDGTFGGVFLATVKVSYFVDYYGGFKIDDRGALVLTLRDGTILARRPFDSSAIGKSLAQSEIFKTYLPQSNNGTVEVKAIVDGTYRLYGYQALENYPLVTQVGLSRESFVGPWRRDLFKTGGTLLLLVSALGGMGLIVFKQLRHRIAMELELQLAHQTVQNMALTDALTGIGNRRKLDMVLGQEIDRARRQKTPLALMMLDVDYFKRFNDLYGHSEGDECLRQIARTVQRALKRPADLVVRYGGEEFTVLLPETDLNGVQKVADEIFGEIRALGLPHADHPLGFVTVSAGVALYQGDGELQTAAGLIKAADALLYLAKNKGRNRWHSVDRDSEHGPGSTL